MTHAIRFHKTGGPRSWSGKKSSLAAWAGRGAHPPHRGWTEFCRHLQPLRTLSRPVAEWLGSEGPPSLRKSDPASRSEARRPRRLRQRTARRLCRSAADSGRSSLKLPDGLDDKTAAAMMLKGLTVQYLIRQTYRVKAGDNILLHARRGGVGLILGQWAKHSALRHRHRRQR